MNYLRNVLLVDDDIDDQEFFTEALTGIENAHLFSVSNSGMEALKILENPGSLPDYIFPDFSMHVMNGIECLVNIKKLTITKDIQLFMLSGAFEQAELSRKLGAKGFIKKSADMATLRTELQNILKPELS